MLQEVLGTVFKVGGTKAGKWSPSDFARERNIHEKSFIEFQFPNVSPLFPNGIQVKLPFYENIDIRESKKANLVTYDPVGRSSSLYAYTGASSRVIKLSFFLTLPHIQAMHVGSFQRFRFEADGIQTKEKIQEDFKKGLENPPNLPALKGFTNEEISRKLSSTGGKKVAAYKSVFHPEGRGAVEVNNPINNPIVPMTEVEIAEHLEALPVYDQPKNYTQYVSWWVNVIRSSVLNNQQNTMQGPPVIRLTHGPLYQNIPCICKSYNISYDPAGGMDKDSLLSRRIKVDMNLEEFRAGNFGAYTRASQQPLDRDNVAGWEAIIEHSTTDPGHMTV